MPNLVGIFPTRDVAELAVQGLLATAISPQSITLLSGEAGKSQVASLTTTDAERDGMGEAVGGIVGGAVGASAGLSLGSAIASLLVPGVGTIFAIGMGAAALLGLAELQPVQAWERPPSRPPTLAFPRTTRSCIGSC
jgi:MFS family permease